MNNIYLCKDKDNVFVVEMSNIHRSTYYLSKYSTNIFQLELLYDISRKECIKDRYHNSNDTVNKFIEHINKGMTITTNLSYNAISNIIKFYAFINNYDLKQFHNTYYVLKDKLVSDILHESNMILTVLDNKITIVYEDSISYKDLESFIKTCENTFYDPLL